MRRTRERASESGCGNYIMTGNMLVQYGVFLLVVTLLVQPLGGYMARVLQREKTFLDGILRPVERWLYKITGVDPEQEMDWKQYALCFVLFGLCGTLLLYAILRLQRFFP